MSRYLPESEVSILQQNGQDSQQSRKSSAIPTASPSSPSTGPMCLGAMTSAGSPTGTMAQLPLFPADSPASLSVAPGSVAARKITEISGRRWRESYDSSSPLGSVLRILLERSTWSSIARLLIWRKRAIRRQRSYYRLSPLARGTRGKGCSSWPTLVNSDGRARGTGGNRSSPTSPVRHSLFARVRMGEWPNPLPTLRAGDAKGGKYQRDHGQKGKERPTLCGILPTLLRRDQRCYSSAQQRPRAHGGTNLVRVSGGKLNADWCEWYMGFPVGWTDIGAEELRPLATRASRCRSTRSCKR